MSSNTEFVPPNSAPENILEGSQKSGKKTDEFNKTQAMNSRQPTSMGINNGPTKVTNVKSNSNMPTHRRSNTAASFVPSMSMKQFQE